MYAMLLFIVTQYWIRCMHTCRYIEQQDYAGMVKYSYRGGSSSRAAVWQQEGCWFDPQAPPS